MKNLIILLGLSVCLQSILISQDTTRLMRFPAIHGNQVVFTYAGDLYIVDKSGGTARKLTNHEGYEMFARFSPDGRHIAFTGQYDGNTEVFVMPAQGGRPERLTYTATLSRDDVSDRMGPNNIVMGWTPDSKNIVFRSRRKSFNAFVGQLFSVPVEGGMVKELPLPRGGFCSYSKDGKKIAYNKVFREFRTWKYYRGGMADDIWIHDFETKETSNITDNDGQDIIPMWHKDHIYYISDRDRTMNLFAYSINNKTTEKLTNFTFYDVKFPSLGDGVIIFENGGYLYLYDIETKKQEKLDILINNDFIHSREKMVDAANYINTAELSQDATRLIFGARGDIFSVPANDGITYNFTKTSGVHERNAVCSPDGKYIAYISDKTGEFEIYMMKSDGSGTPVQLTKDANTYKYTLKWSPDSKKMLWNDKKMRLRYFDIDSKKIKTVYQSDIWEITDFNWSPDSKWITFAAMGKNRLEQVYLFELASGNITPVTDRWYDSDDPVFSDDGKYLLFTSNRDFNPIYSDVEWNVAYKDMTNIYFIPLAKITKSPFAYKDTEPFSEKDHETGRNGKSMKVIRPVVFTIDTEGLPERTGVLPISASNYANITMVRDYIYYLERSHDEKKTKLKVFNLKTEEETTLGDISSYKISADNKRMLVRKGKDYYVVSLPKNKLDMDEKVDLTEMKTQVNLQEEWKQIYYESWRQMRDFFYDPGMHGVDWNAMKEKYEVLLPYVNNRNDLNYVIGELIGELNVGHAYVSGGDKPNPERIKTGLLGAKISKHASGYFRIDKILEGENWRKDKRSPLTESGIDISEGDYIIAVDGEDVKKYDNLYAALVNKASQEVKLTVSASPDNKNTKDFIVKPVDDESGLYYYNWVQENINKVSKATDGKVGYLHIPNMVQEGLNEFTKYFYPQLDKEALIIDDRGNGGGNVSPMIIERLRREITRANMVRNAKIPYHTPRQMLVGPVVLLINQYSASDGDLFPYSFKKHGLGKVIGVRSWGGVVGIRGTLPFIDGGNLNRPEFASYSAEKSAWIIEGYGVDPDIVVINDPWLEYQGTDEQLNKAIEVILEELKKYKQEVPPVPEFPDKSK